MTTKSNSSTGEQETGELLPCPFCGSPAKFEDGGFNAIRVTCTDYDCVQRQRVHKADRRCHAKLIEHWNTRVNSHAELERERDALRKALQKIFDNDDECHCEHDNENCCELNRVFCPRCIAAIALRREPK